MSGRNTAVYLFHFFSVPKSAKMGSKVTTCLRREALLLLTLLGVCVGFVIGFGLREVDPSDDALMWIGE